MQVAHIVMIISVAVIAVIVVIIAIEEATRLHQIERRNATLK